MRSLTTTSISAGDNPAGSADVDTIRLLRAARRGIALKRDSDDLVGETEGEQISVADGSKETIHVATIFAEPASAGVRTRDHRDT